MDKTEFIKLHDFDISESVDPDSIIENQAKENKAKQDASKTQAAANNDSVDDADDDFLAELGL
jgi:hypothetical protein